MQRNPPYKRELPKQNTHCPMPFLGPVHLAVPIPTVPPSMDRAHGKIWLWRQSKTWWQRICTCSEEKRCRRQSFLHALGSLGEEGYPNVYPSSLSPSPPKQTYDSFLILAAQWVGNQRENFKLSMTNTGFKAYPAEFFRKKPGSWADEKPAVRGIMPETFLDTSKSQGTYETTTRNS